MRRILVPSPYKKIIFRIFSISSILFFLLACPVSAAEPQWSYDTKNTITGLTISGDGNYIAASSSNNNVYTFNHTGSLLWTNQSIQKISSVSMPANTQYVAVGGTSLAVFRSTGTPVSKLGLNKPIKDLQYFPDGNYIAFMDSEKIGLFTRLGEGLWLYSINGDIELRDNLEYQHHVAVSDDGTLIIFSPPWAKKMYGLTPGGNYKWVTPLDGHPLSMTMSSRGNYILVGTDNNTISLISTQGNYQWTKNQSEPVTSVAVSFDGSYIVFGGKENVINFVKNDGSYLWKKDLFSRIDAVAVTNNGGYIVTGTEDKRIRVFTSSGDEKWKYDLSGRLRDICLSDNGDYFVTGTDDGKIHFFSIEGIPVPVIVPEPAASVVPTETTVPTPSPTLNVTPLPTEPLAPAPQENPGQFLVIGISAVILIGAVGGSALYLTQRRKTGKGGYYRQRPQRDLTPDPETTNSDLDLQKPATDSDLIFICAKSEDDKYAYPVYLFLTKKGYNVFFSKETLREMGKAEFGEEIDAALERAKHFIVVTSSRENVRSKWVLSECRLFLDEKRAGRKPGNIIVLLAGSTRIEDLPISLRSFETRWLDDPDTLDEILNYLS